MKHIIPIAFLAALAAIAWHVGGMIPPAALTLALGVLFGSMVGIPIALAALTANRRIRHDHYIHATTETPREPQEQPLQLSARPTRYTVVTDRPALPTAAQSRLEVSK